MPVMRDAVVGRPEPVEVAACNLVTGNPMLPPFPVEFDVAVFGTGCFWGTEEYFWQIDGVWTTAVGYAGGTLAHPRYEEVCTGRTGHAEVVLVVFDPQRVTYDDLLRVFWETHDPTQGMRQGNDIGTQYRSVILTTDEPQALQAARSSDVFERALATAGFGSITTEIKPLEDAFFYAEDHHQQYLAKNPHGYRCHVALGVSYPGG